MVSILISVISDHSKGLNKKKLKETPPEKRHESTRSEDLGRRPQKMPKRGTPQSTLPYHISAFFS